MSSLDSLLAFAVLGALAGVPSGLLGIGGGVILVPAMLWAFERYGFELRLIPHLAIGTSLATILFTSLASVWTHHRHGAIDWSQVGQLSVGILFGAAVGARLAATLSGPNLVRLFGAFALLAGARMLLKAWLTTKEPDISRAGRDAQAQPLPRVEAFAAGFGIGGLSSIFGIGGGTLTVPYLSFRGQSMRRAVATSSACGLAIALSGAFTNVVTGWKTPGLPEGTVGFVYLPAVAGISVGSVFSARYGADLAHRVSQVKLRMAFGALLVLVSLRLITS